MALPNVDKSSSRRANTSTDNTDDVGKRVSNNAEILFFLQTIIILLNVQNNACTTYLCLFFFYFYFQCHLLVSFSFCFVFVCMFMF